MAAQEPSQEELDSKEISKAVRDISEFVEGSRAAIRNEDVDSNTKVAFLRKIKSIVSRFPESIIDAGPVKETTNVLYALNPETTGWAAAGVPLEDRPLWELIGVTSEAAGQWVKAGLGVETATRWWYARPYYLRSNAVDPNVVAEWEKTDIPTQQAITWMIDEIGPKVAQTWMELGGSIEEGRTWLSEFPDEQPSDIFSVSKSSLGLKNVKDYTEKGVPVTQAPVFAAKGYTPLAASKLVSKGETAEQVKNLTGDAPVPGKAWLKIKKAADANGWSVSAVATISNSRGRKTVKETRVTFSNPNSPYGDVLTYFRSTRFVRATRSTRSYWHEQTNTITGLVENYLT